MLTFTGWTLTSLRYSISLEEIGVRLSYVSLYLAIDLYLFMFPTASL